MSVLFLPYVCQSNVQHLKVCHIIYIMIRVCQFVYWLVCHFFIVCHLAFVCHIVVIICHMGLVCRFVTLYYHYRVVVSSYLSFTVQMIIFMHTKTGKVYLLAFQKRIFHNTFSLTPSHYLNRTALLMNVKHSCFLILTKYGNSYNMKIVDHYVQTQDIFLLGTSILPTPPPLFPV